MQITDFSFIDNELHSFLTDFVFSVRMLTQADACCLHITNNVLNVVYVCGDLPGSAPQLSISTKQRTHINCLLSFYNCRRTDVYLQFHLKSELEILRKLVEAKLQLFFRQKWQERTFFFEYKQENGSSLKKICEVLREYINNFIDIELIGVSYIHAEEEEYCAAEEQYEDTIRYFAKTAFLNLKKQRTGWLRKKYSDYYLFARKVPQQSLCFLFKGEPHPIYLTAISFMLNELLMLFNSIKWAETKKGVVENLIRSFISSLEAKDVYTKGHSEAVAFYSLEIGKALKLSSTELQKLHTAALLHDIGKVGIPDYILFKPAKLSKTEYEIFKLHTIIGSEIISKIQGLAELAPIIRHHHEKWDGTGYPDRIKEEEIPFFSRIIAIADAYDVMLSKRVYKKPKTKKEALIELERCAGTQFDPGIIKRCLNCLKNCPIYQPTNQSFIPQTIEKARKGYYYRDILTGAKNIRAFTQEVKEAKGIHQFIFFDIKRSHFFDITEGFVKENEVLSCFFELLCEYFTPDSIYRIGGNEFIVVSKKLLSKEKVVNLLNKIEEKLGFKVNFDIKLCRPEKDDVKDIIKDFRLRKYYLSILNNYFELLQSLYNQVGVFDLNLKLIKAKGLDEDRIKKVVLQKEKLKPLSYKQEVIGYAYIEKKEVNFEEDKKEPREGFSEGKL